MACMRSLVGCILTALLVGCGWVDSTGRQTNVAPKVAVESRVLDERESIEIDLSDVDKDGNLTFVDFQVLESGSELAGSCADSFDSMAVFSPSDYADDLASACADGDQNCAFAFAETETGSLKYIATAPGLQRPTAFRYKLILADTDAAETEEEFTLCLRSVSEPPVADDDSFNVEYGTERVVSGVVFDDECGVLVRDGVQQNDEDDFDILEAGLAVNGCLDAELLTAPTLNANAFELSNDGGFSYLPSPLAVAGMSDTFTYQLNDGVNVSEPATVTVRIVEQGSNTPPQTLDPAPDIAEDTTLQLTVTDLATDDDGDALEMHSVGLPEDAANGDLYFESGFLRYTPAEHFFGEDRFSYVVRDSAGATSAGTVSVTIQPINDRPEVDAVGSTSLSFDAVGDVATLYFDVSDVETPLAELLLDAQSSDLSVVSAVVSVNTAPDVEGDVQVDFTAEGPGDTSVVVVASDGVLDGSDTVDVAVASPNTPPSATPATATVELGDVLRFNVVNQGAVTDDDGDDLSLVSVALAAGSADTTGAVTISGQRVIRYAPGVAGTHVIEFSVTDGTDSAASTLTVDVTTPVAPPNTPPTATTTGTAAAETGVELRFDVVVEGAASDVDVGDTLTLVSAAYAAGSSDATGALAVVDSEIVYTPGSAGTRVIDFVVTDGTDTAAGQVTVTVTDP